MGFWAFGMCGRSRKLFSGAQLPYYGIGKCEQGSREHQFRPEFVYGFVVLVTTIRFWFALIWYENVLPLRLQRVQNWCKWQWLWGYCSEMFRLSKQNSHQRQTSTPKHTTLLGIHTLASTLVKQWPPCRFRRHVSCWSAPATQHTCIIAHEGGREGELWPARSRSPDPLSNFCRRICNQQFKLFHRI